MLFCPINRETLLKFLPQNAEVAEIGVAQGAFSEQIVSVCRPARLHLIDPWEHQERDDYQNDGNNASAADQESRYQNIKSRYQSEIDAGRVVLHREYSSKAASGFSDHQFDWIYIDGLHTREAALEDLKNYRTKVKPNGFILGHDYTNHARAREMQFGVVEAVDQFVSEQGYLFLALTNEAFPTYVLVRREDEIAIRYLTTQIIIHVPGTIEIRDFPKPGGFAHHIIKSDQGVRFLPSF